MRRFFDMILSKPAPRASRALLLAACAITALAILPTSLRSSWARNVLLDAVVPPGWTIRARGFQIGWLRPWVAEGLLIQTPRVRAEVPVATGQFGLLRLLLSPSELGRIHAPRANLVVETLHRTVPQVAAPTQGGVPAERSRPRGGGLAALEISLERCHVWTAPAMPRAPHLGCFETLTLTVDHRTQLVHVSTASADLIGGRGRGSLQWDPRSGELRGELRLEQVELRRAGDCLTALRPGRVIRPARGTVRGRFAASFTARLHDLEPAIEVRGGRLVDQMVLDDELSRSLLGGVDPRMVVPGSLRGTVAIDIASFRVPLANPTIEEIAVDGVLLLDDVQFQPGPSLISVLKRAGINAALSLHSNDRVECRLDCGRLEYEGLRIASHDRIVEARGWVSVDGGTSLVLNLPMTRQMLGSRAGLYWLVRDQRVDLPLRGTVRRVVVAEDELARNITRLVGGGIRDRVVEAGGRLFEELGGALR